MTRSSHLGSVAVLALGVGACARGDAGTSPKLPAGPTTIVQVGGTVDPAVKAQITRFVGLGGSVGSGEGGSLVLPDSSRSAVMALNASGDAVLAALATPGVATALDARSSALLLVRLAVQPDMLVPGQASALEAVIAARPGFQALVDSVDARARRGLPLTRNRATVLQAAAVAADLSPTAAHAPAAGRGQQAGSESIASFTRYADVAVNAFAPTIADGGTVTLSSRLAAPLKVITPAGPLFLGRSELCVTCWRERGTTTPTGRFDVALPGRFEVSVDVDRDMVIGHTVLDIASLLFKGLSDKFIPDGNAAAKNVLTALGAAVSDLAPIFRGNAPEALPGALRDWAIGNAGRFGAAFAAIVPGWQEAAAIALVKNAIPGAVIFDAYDYSKGITQIGLTIAAAAPYWGQPPEIATWCISARRLYGGCVAKVEVLAVDVPTPVTLQPQQQAQLRAVATDDAGRLMVDHPAQWTSSSGAVATLVENGANATLRAVAEGMTTVAAAAGGRTGTLFVQVAAVDSLAIYGKAILGMWTRANVMNGESFTVEFRENNRVAHFVARESYGCRVGVPVGDHCEVYTSWRLWRENGRYFLADGSTGADYGHTRDPITMPVTGYTTYLDGKTSYRFTKH